MLSEATTMLDRDSNPYFAFVWRAQQITSSVVGMARSTGICAIFDFSALMPMQYAQALRVAGAKHVKITPDYFLDITLTDFMEKSCANTIWVEYNQALTDIHQDIFLERLENLSLKYNVIPITGDPELLASIVQMDRTVGAIAIKGSEAAGFVSAETTGILYSIARQMPRQYRKDLIIWGGIATPEAAAAFLTSGVTGIVFESLHWLTSMVEIDDNLRERLTRLQPDHTRLIGQRLGVFCRLFDKGNSIAVKKLESHADSLCQGEITARARHSLVSRIHKVSIPALESCLSSTEIIPLGPEAAFAESFAQRFGKSTGKALEGFVREIERLCHEAAETKDRLLNSHAAKRLGTKFPFIQGAMTWITDVPAFALAVAEAGALPTIALGMKNKGQLDHDLGNLAEIMGNRPFAINMIALAENPYRDQQTDWILQMRPPFVVIAAGEPSYIAKFRKKGIEAIYIAPDEAMMSMALTSGARFLVLEGNEAGGHVGTHSMITLAQIALEFKRRNPSLFNDRYLILAGGIYDRETAFRAAMLGADAIQMGTAYLATREIVDSGALSPLYQRMILESGHGLTTITGTSVGLRVRSLKTPKIEAICALERKMVSGGEDEDAFRRRIEAMSAGSLLIASRGVKVPGGPHLDEKTHSEEGQFMSGSVCGLIRHTSTIAALHRELAEGDFTPVSPQFARKKIQVVYKNARKKGTTERIAITGMAMVNSLGNSPREVWEASLALKSGVIEAPRIKLDLTRFYDPNPRANGKTYCKVGAFHNLTVSRKDLGIPPQDFRTMSGSTKQTLWLAGHAINQSGILESGIRPERIGVLVSQNSGEAASTIMDLGIYVNIHDIIHAMQDIIPITPEQESAIENHIKSGIIGVDDTTLLGRLNCAASGFICNKYGFMGPSHSVSAACATSLVALHSAVQMINNNIIDAAVVGGGEEILRPAHYLEFSALGALAGISNNERPPRELSRPFDAARDGMVLGEGGAMIVIERESVARRRGANICAYITGIGASNNNRGMVESLAETQQIAIRSSFEDAGYTPNEVDMVECHATGTVQGDVEEVKALRDFFPSGKSTTLTSFKSQIGHTLGASGLNSLIHGVMAMQEGIFPPTLNYQTPDPEIALEAWGFHVPIKPEDWPQPAGPRRLMVNAFGFGGSNYVVQLEQCQNDSDEVFVSLPDSEQALGYAHSEISMPMEIDGLCFYTGQVQGKPYRLSVVADDDKQARKKVAAFPPIKHGMLSPRLLREMARAGIFISQEGTSSPPLAFVFAGQGTHYQGMGKELYETFPLIREWMDRIAAVADFDILDLLFNSREEDLQKTRWQQPALFTMEYAMVQYLMSMGVIPQALAGHSLGELVALCAAGVFSYEDGFHIVNKRAQCMDKAAGLSVDPGAMIAVDGPLEMLKAKIAERENIFFTNFNSPHQIVLGGGTDNIQGLMEELQKEGCRTTRLKVSMAFHSPIMKVIHDEMEAYIADMLFHAPGIPVISNTTMRPFPSDPDEIKKIVMAHLESPVHWMQNVTTLWNDHDIRLFVEIGPKDTLCNMISEITEQAQCINTCEPEKESFTFRTAMARLFTMSQLKPLKSPDRIDLARASAATLSVAEKTAATPADNPVSAIIQREINAFILESFGRILRPQILSAIKREIDPSFSYERLEDLLPPCSNVTPPAQVSIPEKRMPSFKIIQEAQPSAKNIPPSMSFDQRHPAPAEGSQMEQIIRIIMDATGYERDEIEPDMDIRQDLAIRSSRLPVIMDAAERTFGITIALEDFIGVRSIKDMSDRISEIMSRDGKTITAAPPEAGTPIAPAVEAHTAPSENEDFSKLPPLMRLVLSEAPLEKTPVNPLGLKQGVTVAVIHGGAYSGLASELGDLLSRKYRLRTVSVNMVGRKGKNGGYDLRTAEGAKKASDYLTSLKSLAGIILALDEQSCIELEEVQDITKLLTGFFSSMKALLHSQAKRFCLVIRRGLLTDSPSAIAAEGVLGMYLAAAQEYSSMMFRSVSLDMDTDIQLAMDLALDRDNPVVQIVYRGQDPFTLQITNHPIKPTEPLEPIELRREDVVVISGGARGITSHMARALAPFGVKLALLGRTELQPLVDDNGSPMTGQTTQEALRRIVTKRYPGITADSLEIEIKKAMASAEVTNTLKCLSDLGLKAEYYTCDVSDVQQTTEVVDKILKRYGKIDCIIHGAGILRDSFMEFMNPEDFSQVIDVKLLGFWNLLLEASGHGLRMVVGLSSIAAVLGNPGQVNYCAASRSLWAAINAVKTDNGPIVTKTLMLPPIEGLGMAADPEIKDLMKLRGMDKSYIHVNELTGLFLRELFLSTHDQRLAIWARAIPQTKIVRMNLNEPVTAADGLYSAGVTFERYHLPMIREVRLLNLEKGELEVRRNFSPEHDLWLLDHSPFKFLKHPIVSGIMAIETFLETAHVLYPHLRPLSISNVEYKDILMCPPGTGREARIVLNTQKGHKGQKLCDVLFSSRDISPTGRPLDHWTTNYQGQVILGGHTPSLSDWPDFTVSPDLLDTRPLAREEIAKKYQDRSNLQGRYRVLYALDGTGPGVISGSMIYRESSDFSGLTRVLYQYPPYLLEALAHMAFFYVIIRDEKETRNMIPASIGEICVTRSVKPGESILMAARVKSQDKDGLTWDACATDENNIIIMQVKSLEMKWFTE